MALRVFLHRISIGRAQVFSPFFQNYCKMSDKVNAIDFSDLTSKMQSGTLLVDVREPSELQNDGKIPNSVNIPLGQITEAFKLSDGEFLERFGVPKPGKEFVLSCRSGKRATDAFQRVQALGYKNALVYSGSFQDWVKNGGGIEK